MEAAGRGVAEVVARAFPRAVRQGVLLVAGHGNNGGDGWVAARALRAAGATVRAVETGSARSHDCEANRRLALDAGVELLGPDASWPNAGVVIDALLGTGASGAPRGEAGALAERIAGQAAPVVAIDGPTGLDLSTGEAHGPCRATLTVTFGGARRGHLLAREWCGRIVIVDIGFPPADPAWPTLFEDRVARDVLPPMRADMHKGDRGRVLVIGGDEGMTGAALHAASAALAAGAGLVRLAASPATVRAAQAALPDVLTLVTRLGPELEPALAETMDWADALVLGPGLGRGTDRTRFACAVLARSRRPVIVDADALHAREALAAPGTAPRVLTPHPGEFRAAFPELEVTLARDRFAAARDGARAAGAVVLLKGVPTIVAPPDEVASMVVAAGNPALATGGSGDLLAGFIGSYLARRLPPRTAAALGALTLGRAAELAAADLGVRSTRPADVLAALPEWWRVLAAPVPIVPPILVELDLPAVE
jgi:NAD(P)H-hydrate epimerase